MFIRYNELAKWWEYDSALSKDGKGPWVKLPIDYSQIYNPPTIPPPFVLPANVALKDVTNQFTRRQRISNASGDIPRITFTSVGDAVDKKVWEINHLSENLNFWALNDTEAGILGAITMYRDGRINVKSVNEGGRAAPLGYWKTVAFNPADYTTTDVSTVWTINTVAANQYTLIGQTMIWTIAITDSTLSNSNSYGVIIKIPDGITTPAPGAAFATKIGYLGNGPSQQLDYAAFIQDSTHIIIHHGGPAILTGALSIYLTMILSIN